LSAEESYGASLEFILNLSLFFRIGIAVTFLSSCIESFDSEILSDPSSSLPPLLSSGGSSYSFLSDGSLSGSPRILDPYFGGLRFPRRFVY